MNLKMLFQCIMLLPHTSIYQVINISLHHPAPKYHYFKCDLLFAYNAYATNYFPKCYSGFIQYLL